MIQRGHRARAVALTTLALLFPGIGHAFSFVGSDWTWRHSGVTKIRIPALGISQDLPDAQTTGSSVSQSSSSAFSFPVNFGLVSGTGDFTVSGTTVTDVNSGKTTDPFPYQFGNQTLTLRATYPTFNLEGEVTGVEPGQVDGFGARAWQITGNPVTISNIGLEVLQGNSWVSVGNASSYELQSWSLTRPVPEPGMAAALLASLGLAQRRQAREKARRTKGR